jgi:hypothetical protein
MAAFALAVAAYASTPANLPDAPSQEPASTQSETLLGTPAITAVRPRLPEPTPRYHWRGLLLQSLEFNLIENGFRLATDDTMRFQIAHKPFWHDYVASVKQFNMRRWNDGDSFIVNYVGHPLQGSVGAFIEIQNSEAQARLRWNEPGYWRSRALAFLWTTAYSTHSEISPFGEAGIGSEGGFTYGVKCMEHCDATNFHPGDKYTNNTGWVDFIVTPTVGMLWVFAEDYIDKDVVPLIFGDDHPVAAKILRGSLNPSRSFANMLRGRKPWYRDYEHPAPTAAYKGYGEHFLPSDEEIEWRRSLPRHQIAPHLNGLSIASNTAGCANCRNLTTGAGVEFSTRLLPVLDFDGDVSYQPGASPLPGDRAGGNALRAVFGVRLGYETEHYAIRVAVRPGFVRWDRAYTTSSTTIVLPNNQLGQDRYVQTGQVIENPPPKLGPILHFDWNVQMTGDYKLSSGVALRAGIGEDLVRYRTNVLAAEGVGEPPYLSWLSRENYVNRGNWSYQFGPVFSF